MHDWELGFHHPRHFLTKIIDSIFYNTTSKLGRPEQISVIAQDGCILVKLLFSVFMDRVGVSELVIKGGQILTDQAWSAKNLLYGFR